MASAAQIEESSPAGTTSDPDGPIVVRGTVIPGDRRGRELGFPTANLRLPAGSDVSFGVYAGTVDGRPAAISVGVRPTFGDGHAPLLEAHLLDFTGDLYGRAIMVVLHRRLRTELRFASADELVAQMHTDVASVRRWWHRTRRRAS